MRGVHGRTGWFYLFLIEGLLTLGIGIIVSTYHKYSTNSDFIFILINHKELALLATISHTYKKHFVPQVMVHRAPRGNHDQRKSTYSTHREMTIKLNNIAPPP